MKKVSLKNLKLDASDLLKKEQQKTILGGGSGRTGCCAYESSWGLIIDASKATAQSGAAQSGGHWCCDNCATASWTQGYQGCS